LNEGDPDCKVLHVGEGIDNSSTLNVTDLDPQGSILLWRDTFEVSSTSVIAKYKDLPNSKDSCEADYRNYYCTAWGAHNCTDPEAEAVTLKCRKVTSYNTLIWLNNNGSVAVVLVVFVNVIADLFKSFEAIRKWHIFLALIHFSFFASGVWFSILTTIKSCTFMTSFLDSVALLFLHDLDETAWVILGELGMAEAFLHEEEEELGRGQHKHSEKRGAGPITENI